MDHQLRQYIDEHFRKNYGAKKFIPGVSTVAASGKSIDAEDMAAMVGAVLEGWWTEGPHAAEFEAQLSQRMGAAGCITTTSGSSANLLALACLTSTQLGERRLRRGDEVITIAAGFPTTINPVILYGLIPVFVDVELNTMNASIEQLAKAISLQTKAIFMPHNLGVPFDVAGVQRLCQQHQLWLIEDCCDALGSIVGGNPVGSFGDLATFSCYAGHHLTMGEGGAVVAKTKELARLVRRFRDWGRDCWCRTGEDNACGKRFRFTFGELPPGYDHKYVFTEVGYNLKITDIQAAAGVSQLKKLDTFTQRRRRNFEVLSRGLAPYHQWLRLPQAPLGTEPSWFGFSLTVRPDAPFTRQELINYLESAKIATRLILAGNLTKQPYLKTSEVPYRQVGELPNTDTIMRQSFWVGCFHGLGDEEMAYIVKAFREFFRRYR